MNSPRLLLFFLVLSCTDFGQATSPQSVNHRLPPCLAEFCFDKGFLLESELVKRYGSGYTTGDAILRSHCYAVPDQKLFVYFLIHHAEPKEVVAIFASDVPNCIKANRSKAPFRKFMTREKLQIGDSYQKVIDTYGKPDSIEKGTGWDKMGIDEYEAVTSAPFGDTVLSYGSPTDQLLQAEIYLRNGKVSAILISASE